MQNETVLAILGTPRIPDFTVSHVCIIRSVQELKSRQLPQSKILAGISNDFRMPVLSKAHCAETREGQTSW